MKSRILWLVPFVGIAGMMLLAARPHGIVGSPGQEPRYVGVGSPAWSGGGRIPASTSPVMFDAARTVPLCVGFGSIIFTRAVSQNTTFCLALSSTITIATPSGSGESNWGNVTTSSITRRRGCWTLEPDQERWVNVDRRDLEGAYPEQTLRLCSTPINVSYQIGYGRSVAEARAVTPYCNVTGDCTDAYTALGTCAASGTTDAYTRETEGCAFLVGRPAAAADIIVEVYR